MKYICLGYIEPGKFEGTTDDERNAIFDESELGGIQILEARALNHAVQLISQLPGFKYGLGPVELRPVADISEMMKESERRQRKDTSR